MRVALVENHYGPVELRKNPTWGQLCSLLTTARIGSKEGAGWIAADIAPGPRRSERVSSVSYLVVDVEERRGIQPPSVASMAERISALNYRCLLHTTYNHNPAAPRYRIVFPVRGSFPPRELKSALAAITKKLRIHDCYDTSCTDPARVFYLPRCEKSRRKLFEAHILDGLAVDVYSLRDEEITPSTGKIICPVTAKLLYFPTPEPPEIVAKVHSALSYINANCSYQIWRDIVWAVLSTGWHAAERMARDWSKSAADRFDERSFQSVVRSFDISGGITLGTLYHHAKAAGWIDQSTSDISDDSKHFNLMTFEQVQRLTPTRWMIKGLLPTNGVAAVYGQPGSGKSFAVLDLLLHLSLGWSWFGYTTRQCPVVYVALEGGAGVTSRLKAWCQHHGKQPADNFRVMMDVFSLLLTDIEALAAEINGQGLGDGVIALDTLAQSAPGTDENSSADMGKVISRVQRLQTLTGSLVILVHHTGKDTARGLRGHSSLLAALDAAIEVTKSDAGREWKVKKSKDGVDGVGGCFGLKVVCVGTDEDGDDITSCVVEPDSTREVSSRRSDPRGKNQKTALRVVRQLAGNRGLADSGEVLERMIAELHGSSERHKPERAKKAIDDLIERHFIREVDGSYELI